MLLELSIKDYILIEDATMSFGSNLNVMTGETGAGKSMLLGAIGLLLGKKASASDIRAGAEKAFITAVFDGEEKVFDEFSIPRDNVLVLTREIHSNGRSIARANGLPVTVQVLRHISQHLVTIHGQNDQLELFSSDYQLSMLDTFANHNMLEEIFSLYRDVTVAKKNYERLCEERENRYADLDYLRFQLREIEEAALTIGEDEELEKEYQYLVSLEKVGEAVNVASMWLSEGEYPALSGLSEVSRSLKNIANLSSELEQLYEYATQAEELLGDFSSALFRFTDGMSLDTSRMYEVEQRLDQVNRLKMKFGNSLSDIIQKGEEIASRVDMLEHIDEELENAKEKWQEAQSRYDVCAQKLTAIRQEAAKTLARKIEQELHQLNMKESEMEVAVYPSNPSSTGSDEVDIKISTAVGHQRKSLKKVVSGGELSRIMLAIKMIIGGDATMLFDEVDAGISGITATVVGEKLATLSADNQLILITHLPQIAVFADRHIVIEKTSDEVKTVTSVRILDLEGQVEEIARLVGGIKTNSATYLHAKEMLKMARRQKAGRTKEA